MSHSTSSTEIVAATRRSPRSPPDVRPLGPLAEEALAKGQRNPVGSARPLLQPSEASHERPHDRHCRVRHRCHRLDHPARPTPRRRRLRKESGVRSTAAKRAGRLVLACGRAWRGSSGRGAAGRDRVRGRREVGPPKNGKTRTISPPRSLRDMLTEHLGQPDPQAGARGVPRPAATRSSTRRSCGACSVRPRRRCQLRSKGRGSTTCGARARRC